MNSLHIHILEHEDSVRKFYSKKEIELIFLWYNIEDIDDWDLKLRFFSLLLLTSNNLCLSRLESLLILMQYMYVCIYAWSITFEWMNQSELHERRTEELASISFVSIWGITDGAWLQWTSRCRFNVIFFFSLSLSLSLFLFLPLLLSLHYFVFIEWSTSFAFTRMF
jgi:hypothetical protein